MTLKSIGRVLEGVLCRFTFAGGAEEDSAVMLADIISPEKESRIPEYIQGVHTGEVRILFT